MVTTQVVTGQTPERPIYRANTAASREASAAVFSYFASKRPYNRIFSYKLKSFFF
jgi:hypothetical protein